MKKRLVFALLPWALAARAQTLPCATLQTENTALKDKLTAYEARLGIGSGSTVVVDGDPTLPVKFLSCKASRATHRAVLSFLVTNAGEPVQLQIQALTTADEPSLVVDEQGRAYSASSDYYPRLGTRPLQTTLPPNLPLSCSLTLLEVPTGVIRLNQAVLSFVRLAPSGGREQRFKTTIRNMPVTWVP
jgi:hypothetical protein